MLKNKIWFCLFLICGYFLVNIQLVYAQKYTMAYLYGRGDYISFVNKTGNVLNEVSPSYYDVITNKGLVINSIDSEFINNMHSRGIKVIPFFSNHWDRIAGREALANRYEIADKIANSIIENNLDGINVDLENLTEVDKESYINFVKILRDKLPDDKAVIVSVAANPYGLDTGWQGSYDYKKLGEIADYIVLMAYDEHYEGGTAGSVAGIEFVEDSVKYAIDKIDSNKIILGIPLYGRYWQKGTSYGGKAVSLTQMEELISTYNSKVNFDEDTKSMKAEIIIKSWEIKPKIYGETLSEGTYEFYYENEASISAKLDLIEKYNIKGAGVWRLGMEEQNIWKVFEEKLNDNFKYFSDVPNDYWASKYINSAKENKLIEGKTVSIFEPESNITRGELATIICRIIDKYNLAAESSKAKQFKDLNSHWAKSNIEKVSKYGVISGYTDGTFKPNNAVTRAEASKMISILLEKIDNKAYQNITQKQFIDISTRHWAYEYINKLTSVGIINGYTDNSFRPEAKITRAEVTKIIQKIME